MIGFPPKIAGFHVIRPNNSASFIRSKGYRTVESGQAGESIVLPGFSFQLSAFSFSAFLFPSAQSVKSAVKLRCLGFDPQPNPFYRGSRG
jgi:hypothetical protein